MKKTYSFTWNAYGYGEVEAETEEEAYEKLYDKEQELFKDAEGFSVEIDEIER